jgi:hypothetical protein
MKKSTDKTAQRRKLVVNREAITQLTTPQLAKVAGGWTYDWDCASAELRCVNNPM